MPHQPPHTLSLAGLALALSMAFLSAAVDGQAPPAVSRQQSDVFARKLSQIAQVPASGADGTHRTAVTEAELNSWFTYAAPALLPRGVSQPQLTMIGDGRVAGRVTLDLDAIARPRASGGLFDPWSYLSGRVPVNVAGILRTQNGTGRFELEAGDVSGLAVPKVLLQQLVSAYSRTTNHPQGVKLDEPFGLPAGIRQIDVAQGRAVVVQ